MHFHSIKLTDVRKVKRSAHQRIIQKLEMKKLIFEFSLILMGVIMSFQISCDIYAHILVIPPLLNSSCNIDLILRKSQGQISLVKKEINFKTKYLLTVHSPFTLGLTSYEQNVVEAFVDDLVLSMNLNLKRVALSPLKVEISKPDIKIQPENRVRVEETSKEKISEFRTEVFIQDFSLITINVAEEIDEGSILSIFRLINKLNLKLPHPGHVDNLRASNLKKALTEYRSAMNIFDRPMIFKHLFNSLEIATNWDGIDRCGKALDKEISAITGLQQSIIKKWRRLYDRMKHTDREPKEINEFISGILNLHNSLELLRIATNKILINRLERTISI